MKLLGILMFSLLITLWVAPIGSVYAKGKLQQGSPEFQKEIEKLNNYFINSPEVVGEINRLEEKYPEQSGKGKYQKGGHQYTTYIVAKAAGLDRDRSYKLSYFSQLPDDEITFSATLAFFYLFDLEYRKQIMAVLHSLHGGDQAMVKKRRIDLRDLIYDGIKNNSLKDEQIGLIIHALADSYSHTMIDNGQMKAFDYKWGHLFHGHKPDLIVHNPEKYKKYTCELYKALSLKSDCSPALDKLHEKIKGLETSRLKELPFFKVLAKKHYGYDSDVYNANEKKWKNLVENTQLVETISIIETKTKSSQK